MARVTKKQLEAAAKELNEVLVLKPAIVIKDATVDSLTKEIGDVVEKILEPGDEFSAATTKTLKNLGHTIPVPAKEDDEPPEDEPATEPPAKKAPAKKAASKKAAPKEKADPFQKRDFTRFSCTADVLKAAKKALTKEELAERANAMYAEKGGADNLKEGKWAAKVVMDVAEALGVATVEDGAIALS